MDSTILTIPGQLKGCVAQLAGHYCPPSDIVAHASRLRFGKRNRDGLRYSSAGVAQLVEHHLAKVDVASSSLVTRSSLLMFYLYLLKSESHPRQPYVGSTCDLRQRLRDHNQGLCSHTARFRPWIVIAYFAFVHEQTAIALEKYLKSGSGRAFINRHSV